jgi:hypothetical protein
MLTTQGVKWKKPSARWLPAYFYSYHRTQLHMTSRHVFSSLQSPDFNSTQVPAIRRGHIDLPFDKDQDDQGMTPRRG